MDLARQMEEWKIFWEKVYDGAEIDRQLRKLRWLEEFAFHCTGQAVTPEMFRALSKQIETAEAKLRALRGEMETDLNQAGQKPYLEPDAATGPFAPISRTAYPETQSTDFATAEGQMVSR